MPSLENENPYQSPNVKESGTSDASAAGGQHLTALEKVLVVVIAIAVAVPVFFTTCIGSGFALLALGTDLHYGFTEQVVFILSLVSFLIAAWAGFVVARWFYRKKTERSANENKRRQAYLGDDQ